MEKIKVINEYYLLTVSNEYVLYINCKEYVDIKFMNWRYMNCFSRYTKGKRGREKQYIKRKGRMGES